MTFKLLSTVLLIVACAIATVAQTFNPPGVYTVTIEPAAFGMTRAGLVKVATSGTISSGTISSFNAEMGGEFQFTSGSAGVVCSAANMNPKSQPALALPFYGGMGAPIIQGLTCDTEVEINFVRDNISNCKSIGPYPVSDFTIHNCGVMCPLYINSTSANVDVAPAKCTGYTAYFRMRSNIPQQGDDPQNEVATFLSMFGGYVNYAGQFPQASFLFNIYNASGYITYGIESNNKAWAAVKFFIMQNVSKAYTGETNMYMSNTDVEWWLDQWVSTQDMWLGFTSKMLKFEMLALTRSPGVTPNWVFINADQPPNFAPSTPPDTFVPTWIGPIPIEPQNTTGWKFRFDTTTSIGSVSKGLVQVLPAGKTTWGTICYKNEKNVLPAMCASLGFKNVSRPILSYLAKANVFEPIYVSGPFSCPSRFDNPNGSLADCNFVYANDGSASDCTHEDDLILDCNPPAQNLYRSFVAIVDSYQSEFSIQYRISMGAGIPLSRVVLGPVQRVEGLFRYVNFSFGGSPGPVSSGSGMPPYSPGSGDAPKFPGSGSMPHFGSGSMPHFGSGSMPHVGSGSMPHVGSGSMPHFGSGSMPHVGSGSMPHVGSGSMPHVGSGAMPNFDPGSNMGPTGPWGPNAPSDRTSLNDYTSGELANLLANMDPEVLWGMGIYELRDNTTSPNGAVSTSPASWIFSLDGSDFGYGSLDLKVGRIKLQAGFNAPFGTVCSIGSSPSIAQSICQKSGINIPYFQYGRGIIYASNLSCLNCAQPTFSTVTSKNNNCTHLTDLGALCGSNVKPNLPSTSYFVAAVNMNKFLTPNDTIQCISRITSAPLGRFVASGYERKLDTNHVFLFFSFTMSSVAGDLTTGDLSILLNATNVWAYDNFCSVAVIMMSDAPMPTNILTQSPTNMPTTVPAIQTKAPATPAPPARPSLPPGQTYTPTTMSPPTTMMSTIPTTAQPSLPPGQTYTPTTLSPPTTMTPPMPTTAQPSLPPGQTYAPTTLSPPTTMTPPMPTTAQPSLPPGQTYTPTTLSPPTTMTPPMPTTAQPSLPPEQTYTPTTLAPSTALRTTGIPPTMAPTAAPVQVAYTFPPNATVNTTKLIEALANILNVKASSISVFSNKTGQIVLQFDTAADAVAARSNTTVASLVVAGLPVLSAAFNYKSPTPAPGSSSSSPLGLILGIIGGLIFLGIIGFICTKMKGSSNGQKDDVTVELDQLFIDDDQHHGNRV